MCLGKVGVTRVALYLGKVVGGDTRHNRSFPSTASPSDPRLPEPWRQLARLSSRAGLPRGPGSGQAGGRGLVDPSPRRPGLSRPLKQIAADRRAVSLEPQLAGRLSSQLPSTGSGQQAGVRRGKSGLPDPLPGPGVAIVWCQDQPQGHFLVRLWEALNSYLLCGPAPVF